jgi:hypothetical protein
MRGVLLDGLTGKPQGKAHVPTWGERNAWVARIERQAAEQRTREMLALAGAPGGRDLVNLLYAPGMPSFRTVFTNADAPSLTPGTSVTPAQNSYPAYTEILSDATLTEDCFAILIHVNGIGVATAAKNALLKLGVDQSGGTSYTDFISHLLVSDAGDIDGVATAAPAGIYYYFPVYIPGGTAIAATISVDNATVGTARVAVRCYGRPTSREMLWYGHGVDSFGQVTATSEGTAHTPGNTGAEGSYVQLGSNTTKPYYFWQVGLGTSDSSVGNNVYHVDLAAGSSTTVNDPLIVNEAFYMGSSEQISKPLAMMLYSYFRPVPSGVGIYGRSSCSGTADTDVTLAAYGVW